MKEAVVEKLDDIHEAKTLIEINDLLGLKSPEELKDLQTCLEELVNSYVIFKTKKDKYLLLKNCPNLKIGRYSANKKGFGFVILDKEEDLYINDKDCNGAIHDDIVLAEIVRQGLKREGRIIRVLKRESKNLIGEVVNNGAGLSVILDDDKIKINLVIDEESLKPCVVGSKVVIELVKELGKNKFLGKVKKVIGHKDDPGIDILSIAYKYNIETEFSSEVEEELKKIPTEVNESDLKGRTDLTNELIFTIDGDDTKDIDDAISIKKIDDYYLAIYGDDLN